MFTVVRDTSCHGDITVFSCVPEVTHADKLVQFVFTLAIDTRIGSAEVFDDNITLLTCVEWVAYTLESST